MRSKDTTIIYVGKAKSLKKRVSSYFTNTASASQKTKQLVSMIEDFEVITTENEHQAFLLENTYIKQHQPKYNILLRDDKTYPFIFQSKHHFPRFSFYRGKVSKSGKHWGPFTNIHAVKDTLDVIQKIFKLRNCPDSFFANRSRPCLQYQIKRCSGPCVGLISQKNYQIQVKHAQLFLQGKSKYVLQQLEEKMNDYADQRNYENAAIIRDQIRQICSLVPQRQESSHLNNYDIVACANSGFRLCYCWVNVVDNQVKHVDRYEFETITGKTVSEYLAQIVILRYKHNPQANIKLKTLPEIDNKAAVAEYLKDEHQVYITWMEQADKWSDFAMNMAKNQLNIPTYRKPNQRFFQSVKRTFDLRQQPERIECIDISHHQGKSTKASCVAMDESGMNSALYRQFNLTTAQPGDDYEAIYKTVSRRYSRLKKEDNLPDLVIIDGGKGQIKKAFLALTEIGLEAMPLISISKGPTRKACDEVYYQMDMGVINQIELPETIKQQFQTIRDEAHRFAIQAHRRSQIKHLTQSQLDTVTNLGPKRKLKLLSHFKDLKAIANADEAQIASIPGISIAMAKQIKQALET
ncbi:MAG: excinuclease ABC subunit C [Legionellales bacterium]|nr:excinuclease ABC subunit C [Legionellales bacterium]|tara:strand:- start:221 stop:1954 length:1734 start_codon:yes stop_codon:yes gene_type:complete